MNFELEVDTIKPIGVNHFRQTIAAHTRGKSTAPPFVLASDFGVLNQFMTLLHIDLHKNVSPGREDQTAQSQNVLRRDTQILQAIAPFKPSVAAGCIYEMREYSVLPGTLSTFVELMLGVLPLREEYSANVGVWIPLSGSRDRLLHLWAYTDLAQRKDVRSAVGTEPAWQEYMQQILPLLQEMRSTLWQRLDLESQ